MADRPIFFDPKGRRARISTVVASVVCALALAVVVVLFVVGSVMAPRLPSLRVNHRATTYRDSLLVTGKGTTMLAPNLRRMLENDLRKRPRVAAKVAESRIVIGYFSPSQTEGLKSLRDHANAMTDVVPEWLHLTADGRSIDYARDYDPTLNPKTVEVERIAKANGLRILPILDNYGLEDFDRTRSAPLLHAPALQKRLAEELAAFLLRHGYDGVHLDFEKMNAQDSPGLIAFARTLHATFAPRGLSVSAAIEVENEDVDFARLADECDFIVPMLYDQHSDDDAPGPIASLDWTERNLERVLRSVPESKVVMGIGNFGYDWAEGAKKAESLTFQGAMTTAAGYRSEPASAVLRFDADSSNMTYAYRDDADRPHRVWYLDAVSAYNQLRVASDLGLRGAAVWVLGSEDPALWHCLDRSTLVDRAAALCLGSDDSILRKLSGRKSIFDPLPAGALDDVRFAYEVSFEGRGEILDVRNRPEDGRRRVTMDEDGLVESVETLGYASPFVVSKSGYLPKKIALTFDDGPDREWTPPILDVLKKHRVPATFFCIGVNVESMPDLVAREYDEGHEIGNHSFTHPDLGSESGRRVKLEINLTQMAIEGATGHSSVLFRPPYNADSEPETPDQLDPVLAADRLGYVTVGENVDPTDWDATVVLASGKSRPRTADDIANFVVDDLRRRQGTDDEGNIVLLHDAGGNRSQTVLALEKLIPQLRAEGYEFVPVSRLMGKTRAGVMPAISASNRVYYTLGRWGLGTAYRLLGWLSSAFVVAIVLGIARVFLITPLALVQRRRERAIVANDPSSISVVIAAYNESKVIVRTIESVLASESELLEIVVVDDGSTDGTGDATRAAFADDPRVAVISKSNGGKASALNEGIERARGELLFHIDADTVLDPRAIGLLRRHFSNEAVAAVAGNVQVGNRVNVLTGWQDLEYVTSQNMDRRAYALLNCITVVPGAVGMWRRAAVVRVGGYQTDTLAEDMDLTWRLRRAGYRLENEPGAYAYTEAPERFGAFLKQRFRWSYGTLQSLVKHIGALGRYGWFGRLALPTQWLFGVVFQALAPLIDLQIALAGVGFLLAWIGPASENRSEALSHWQGDFSRVLAMYGLFIAVELAGAAVALRLEGKSLWRLPPIVLQRFAYRQMMYIVMYRSLVQALSGGAASWGKLVRTGSVRLPR